MKSKVVLFILALLTWLILSWSFDWQHLVVGALVSLLVSAMVGGLFITRPHLLRHPMRYVYFFFAYLPLLLWEVIKANFDVAYRVAHPKLPINPGIVKLKTNLRSDTGITFLANSITLTPGTMTVDVDKEAGILYVHWIDVKEKDIEAATRYIAGRFEPLLDKIFEEDTKS